MMSKEQVEQVKKQILDQIETTFPDEQKNAAKEKIANMGIEELEGFLKQNVSLQQGEQQNPFRLIVKGTIPSYKIDEDESSIAVFEINPISKGHTIIIPKKPITTKGKPPEEILLFAKKIAEKLQEKLKPEDVSLSSSNILGETIINLLPVYKDETLDSERKEAKPEELEALQKLFKEKPKKKVVKEKKPEKIKIEKLELPKERIP